MSGESTLAQLRDFDIRSLVPRGQGVIFGMRENGHVAVQRMDNVGIVVDDLTAAIAFLSGPGAPTVTVTLVAPGVAVA